MSHPIYVGTFWRVYSRQVELEATKEAYEREIDGVTAHFEREISRLKTDLEMEKWRHAEALVSTGHVSNVFKIRTLILLSWCDKIVDLKQWSESHGNPSLILTLLSLTLYATGKS